MDLNTYIKQNQLNPNPALLLQLGASQELIDYLLHTPWNTNFNMIRSISGNSGGGDAEVWLVGNEYTDEEGLREFNPLNNVGDIDHIAELLVNGESYQVFLNGEELPYFESQSAAEVILTLWADSEVKPTMTKALEIHSISDVLDAIVTYTDASTAPISVEVSVKAK